ncbi:MAG: hypothetical protein DRP87_04030 [Spirochaetes bacterium]|nr:MAG: hypothetical protein DRP87_04030 [Spirochaetota bacterium]
MHLNNFAWRTVVFLLILISGGYTTFPSPADRQIAGIYFDKAYLLIKENNIGEAENLLNISLEFYPNYSDALYLKGLTIEKNREKAYEAIALLENALNNATWERFSKKQCILKLSEIFLRISLPEQSFSILQELEDEDRGDRDFIFLYARSLKDIGKIIEAKNLLREAVLQFPEDERIHRILLEVDPLYKYELIQKLEDHLDKGEYLPFPSDPMLLLDIIKKTCSVGLKREFIDYYFSVGGRDPEIFVEMLKTENEPTKSLVDQFIDTGGLGRLNVAREFYQYLPNEELKQYFLQKSSNFSGEMILDIEGDGYYNEKYMFSEGSLGRWIVDHNQDGIVEYEVSFKEGKPEHIDGIHSGMFVNATFLEYPVVSSVTLEVGGTSTRYKIIPGRLDFNFYDGGDSIISPPVMNYEIDTISTEYLRSISESMEEVYTDDYLKVIVEPILRDRLWKRMILKDRGEGKHILFFHQGIPERGVRDTDGDGVFEVTETYRDGKLYSILYDGNNNGIPEYAISYAEDREVQLWDFDEDGIFDCREYISED